jgi:nucleotide-binding universal stress UspA family protein
MDLWKKVCCPVDLSEGSRPALGQAAAIARACRGELLLLHVTSGAGRSSPEALLAPPPRAAAATGTDAARLEHWEAEAERLAPGIVTTVELGGVPAGEIVRFAREFGCDLLVLGTHGRTGLGHLILGSVAEAVIRAAPCPVLVVRPVGPEADREGRREPGRD